MIHLHILPSLAFLCLTLFSFQVIALPLQTSLSCSGFAQDTNLSRHTTSYPYASTFLNDGKYVIVYPAPTTPVFDIYAQDDTKLVQAQSIDPNKGGIYAGICAFPNGGFNIVWQNNNCMTRSFDSSGTPTTSTTTIYPSTVI